jgi:hypothetical protein
VYSALKNTKLSNKRVVDSIANWQQMLCARVSNLLLQYVKTSNGRDLALGLPNFHHFQMTLQSKDSIDDDKIDQIRRPCAQYVVTLTGQHHNQTGQ